MYYIYHMYTVYTGASQNVGLGHEFLRHVERTKVVLYILDGAVAAGRDAVKDFMTLRKELGLYAEDLLTRRSMVFVNKADCDPARAIRVAQDIRRIAPKEWLVIAGSVKTNENLQETLSALAHLIEAENLNQRASALSPSSSSSSPPSPSSKSSSPSSPSSSSTPTNHDQEILDFLGRRRSKRSSSSFSSTSSSVSSPPSSSPGAEPPSASPSSLPPPARKSKLFGGSRRRALV